MSIEAAAKARHEGYRNVLIPAAKTKMLQGPIKMLDVAGPDFTGYELEALWDDAASGFKHRHQFKRIAVGTEYAWLQLFKLAELNAARTWISRKERAGV